jgi:hypothetical protein
MSGPAEDAHAAHHACTGLKLCGAGEWLVEKHGTTRRRSWRRLHIGVDAETGQILAAVLTINDGDDASQVGALLDQIDNPIASCTGDGVYDQETVYADVAVRHPDAAVVVPPRATAVLGTTADSAPTQRDGHRSLQAGHRRRAAVSVRYPSSHRSGDCGWRAEPYVGAWTRELRPDCTNRIRVRKTLLAAAIRATRWDWYYSAGMVADSAVLT